MVEPMPVLVGRAVKAAIDAGAGAAGKQLGTSLVAMLKRLYGQHHPARAMIDEGETSAEELVAMLLARAEQDPDAARALQGLVWEAQELGLVELFAPDAAPLVNRPRVFVNRSEELGRLAAVGRGPETGRAVLVVLPGRPGIGRTSLVENLLAVQLAGRFPDGHHYVDVRTIDPRLAGDPGEVAAALLRKAGVPEQLIPADAARRVAVYQRTMRARRVCVTLDNVGQPGVVEALIPQSGAAMVVAIATEPFAELAGSGADFVEVGPFDAEAGRLLLAEVLGPERLGGDEDAIERVVLACDGIPFVLAVAAGLLKTRPGWTMATLADELEDDERQMSVLRAFGHSMVARVFDATYAGLDADARLVYRRLGLLPNVALSAEAIAQASGLTLRDTKAALVHLEAKYLVTPEPGDSGLRHAMERLVWLHARELVEHPADDTAADVAAARTLVRNWYAATVQYADMAASSGRPLRAIDRDLDPAANPFRTSAEALEWIDAERLVLMATLREASTAGADEDVIVMAERMWQYFTNRRPWADFIEAYELAVKSAQRLGKPLYEARMRCLLSRPLRELSDLDAARRQVDAALALVEDVGNGAGSRLRGSVLEFVGLVALDEGEPDEAFRLFEEAGELHSAAHNPRGEALMLQMMGRALRRSGSYARAEDLLRAALAETRLQEERFQARIRMDLGETLLDLQKYAEAADVLDEAVPFLRSQRMELDERSALVMARWARERSADRT